MAASSCRYGTGFVGRRQHSRLTRPRSPSRDWARVAIAISYVMALILDHNVITDPTIVVGCLLEASGRKLPWTEIL
ncbi:hypothetical protein CCMA1212_004687 [Trichoderma ghanense]|uniref:Uncharacterized protein n=1 Tax=Trichoderma ghanense TaxID=65468 RepID=A0ABY2H4Y1_9HYPO